MTLPLPCPAAKQKRRRRAPDCFACSKRNTKCDRRRPYCSQCLKVGEKCSGYKTQLTWGVGVASRGKLRGLSLPVAKSAPIPKSPPIARPQASSSMSGSLEPTEEEEVKIKLESMRTMSSNPVKMYEFVNMATHDMTPPIIPQLNLAVSQDCSSLHDYNQDPMTHQSQQLPQSQRLRSFSPGCGDGLSLSIPNSIDSLGAHAESYFATPINQSFPNNDIPFMNYPVPIYGSYSSRNSGTDSPVPGIMQDALRGPTYCPEHVHAQFEMSSSISSHQHIYGMVDDNLL